MSKNPNSLARSAGLALALLLGQGVWANELFDGVAPRQFAELAPLPSGSRINGYPLFDGDGRWKIFEAKAGKPSNMGVVYGYVMLVDFAAEDFAAMMRVQTNLNQVATLFYMATDPCAGSHLHSRNTIKSISAQDGTAGNCVTVDAKTLKWGEREVTALHIEVTNSDSGSRYYNMDLFLNPAHLGFPGTSLADWQAAARDADPARKEFFARVAAWANALQDGVAKATAYSKPRDAFAHVPSWTSLAHPKGAVVAGMRQLAQ